MRKIIIIFLVQFKVFSLIPSIEDLPVHDTYFKNYYKHFNSWFNEHIYSWDKAHQFTPKLNVINHWYISSKSHKRFYYQWGVGWDPKTKSVFYTLNKAISSEYFETLSTLKSYKCIEDNQYLSCPETKLELKKTPKSLPKSFPLISKGTFYFQEFVTDSRAFYQGDKLKRIYYNLNDIQVNWLPKELQQLIQKIGLETRLPTDKLSIDNEGRIVVYYP